MLFSFFGLFFCRYYSYCQVACTQCWVFTGSVDLPTFMLLFTSVCVCKCPCLFFMKSPTHDFDYIDNFVTFCFMLGRVITLRGGGKTTSKINKLNRVFQAPPVLDCNPIGRVNYEQMDLKWSNFSIKCVGVFTGVLLLQFLSFPSGVRLIIFFKSDTWDVLKFTSMEGW